MIWLLTFKKWKKWPQPWQMKFSPLIWLNSFENIVYNILIFVASSWQIIKELRGQTPMELGGQVSSHFLLKIGFINTKTLNLSSFVPPLFGKSSFVSPLVNKSLRPWNLHKNEYFMAKLAPILDWLHIHIIDSLTLFHISIVYLKQDIFQFSIPAID